jgi:aminoglycoside 3-N-acetyltransferase
MKSALEVYPEVFPNEEILDKTIVRFVDDTFLGDSTTGVPTIWLFHSDKGDTIQHNTCVDMSWVEESQFRRILSIFTFVTLAATTDIVPIKDMLDNALRHAQEAIVNAENRNLGDAFLSYVKNGEKQRIINFKTISDSSLIDEYANKIDDTYIAYEGEMGKWQSYAKTIIPKRVHKGFPQDKLFLPREKRNFRLPDGILYGPFGLILSAMDGKKDLERIIRECLFEHGLDELSDSSFKEYVLSVLKLSNAGYLSVTELNPLTKDDLVVALRELGLKKTDIVALHSSLSACGHLQGGANALIEAFRECSNTLIAPTFTRSFIAFEGSVNKGKTFSPYDKNDISSVWTGAVPKAMLKMGAKRSNHATHSWCGLGEKTDELISAQKLLDPPTCSTSPLAYAHKAGGKIVLYGVSVGGLTFLHYLEDEANAKFLANAVVKIKNDDGSLTTEVIHRHLPGCRGFYGDTTFSSKIMRTLIAKGLEIKSVNFGIGKIMMIDMKQLYDLGMEAFREDKNATLCERPDCTFCRKFD